MGKCNCSNSISKFVDVSQRNPKEWADAAAILGMTECGNVIIVNKSPYEMTEEDRDKLNNIIINGEGDLYLSDDGTYKTLIASATLSQKLVYCDNPDNFIIRNNEVIREILESLDKSYSPQVRMDISGSDVPVQVVKDREHLLFLFEGYLIHIPEKTAELHRFLAFVSLNVSSETPEVVEYIFEVQEAVDYLPLTGGVLTGDLSFYDPSGTSKIDFYDEAATIEADTSGNLVLQGGSISLETTDSSFSVENEEITIRTGSATFETDNLIIDNSGTVNINTSLLNYNGHEVATVKDVEGLQTHIESQIDLVSEALQGEIDRATTAEEELTKFLHEEITRAKEAEGDLQTQIEKEVERATAEENRLTEALDNEITRAKEIEADLQSQVNKAVAVEEDLQIQINDHLAEYDSFTTHVNDSFQTVHTGLGNLQTQITENKEDILINTAEIDALREDFNNQEHFRGVYTASIDIVTEVILPENGDYAYSLESNTVWTYDGINWSDSGTAIPTGVYSFSDNTPLMDMAGGSSGTANTISRSDHKHPSDITKANVTDLDHYLSLAGNSQTTSMTGDIWLGSTNQIKLSDSGASYLGLEADEATLALRGNGTGGVDITSDSGTIKANGQRIIVDGENASPTVIQSDTSQLSLSAKRASLESDRIRLKAKESATIKTATGDIILHPEEGSLYYGTSTEPGNEVAKVSDVDSLEESMRKESEENYLPLSGGTLTGSLTLSSGNVTVQGDQSVRFNGNGSTRISYNTTDDELEIIASTTNYGVDVVTNPSVPESTFKYNGVEVATVGDLENYYTKGEVDDLIDETAREFDNYYTKNEADELLDKKQDVLTAGDNITITNNRISADKSVDIAVSDEVLTYGPAGLKANLSVKVEGNHIRVLGKDGIVVGEFSVLQSQIIDHVEVVDGFLNITFVVKDGSEEVKIDLSDFIDVYEGSEHIDVTGKVISLDYNSLRDELLNDGFAVDNFVDLTSAQSIDGVKTFNDQGRFLSTVVSGNKTSVNDGVAGTWVGNKGDLYLQGERPTIQFYKGDSTTATSSISENSSGVLTINSGERVHVTPELIASGGLMYTPIEIPDLADLNHYITPGFYKTSVQEGHIINNPSATKTGGGDAFSLIVSSTTPDGITQLLTTTSQSGSKMYFRSYCDTAWSEWKRVLTSVDDEGNYYTKEEIDNDVVKLTGDQTISGIKIFTSDIQVNDNKVWHAGNDGAGSGLDADLLDGLDGNRYVKTFYVGGDIDAVIEDGVYRTGDKSTSNTPDHGYGQLVVYRGTESDTISQIYIGYKASGNSSYEGRFYYRSTNVSSLVDGKIVFPWNTLLHENDTVNNGGNLLTTTPLEIVEGSDMNDLTTVGFYRCYFSSATYSLLNCPTRRAFSLFVEKHSGVKQTLTEYSEANNITSRAKIWIRNYYEFTREWSDWHRLSYADETSQYGTFTNLPAIAGAINLDNIYDLRYTYLGEGETTVFAGGGLTGGVDGALYTFTATNNGTGDLVLTFSDVPTIQANDKKWTIPVGKVSQLSCHYINGKYVLNILDSSNFLIEDDLTPFAKKDEVVDLTNDQTIGGNKTFSNSIWSDANFWSNGKKNLTDGRAGVLIGEGAIELSREKPFIDFHFENSTEDYTSRIIEKGKSNLQIESSNGLDVRGAIRGSASIYTGGKISADTGTGIYLGADGTIHMNHTSSPSINFHYGNNENVTSQISEKSEGVINVSKNLNVGEGLQWKGILIPVNSDLDDYTTPGFYYCFKTLDAQSIANVPEELAFSMLVLKDAYYRQIFFCYNASNEVYGKIYTRNQHGSGWTGWSEILTDKSNIDANTLEGLDSSKFLTLNNTAVDVDVLVSAGIYRVSSQEKSNTPDQGYGHVSVIRGPGSDTIHQIYTGYEDTDHKPYKGHIYYRSTNTDSLVDNKIVTSWKRILSENDTVNNGGNLLTTTPKGIATGTNLNDIMQIGFYSCLYSATAQSLTNCPTPYAFSLLVESGAGFRQTLVEYMTDNDIDKRAKIWTRNYYRGETVNEWSAWHRIPYADETPEFGTIETVVLTQTLDLSALPYSINSTVSGSFTLSGFTGGIAGKEWMISILNSSAADIKVTLPSGAAYQTDDTTYTIGGGRIGEISVRYLFGRYVLKLL